MDNIKKWLNQCAAIAYDKPKVRETIIQYNHLLTQITAYNMEDNNSLVEEITSNNDYLRNAILICSLRNEIIKKAIMGPIKQALENIQKIAQDRINPLKVEFKPDDDFGEKSEKIDWSFSYVITDGKHTVNLKYIFDRWGLNGLYYGILKQDTSREIPLEQPIFNNQNEIWSWGWEWMPFKYQSWNGEDLYNLIGELTGNAFESSDFYKIIVDSIQKASELLKMDSDNLNKDAIS